jgi:DUF4097 and DUF4098 domain-containing protein YvlB
MLLTAGLAIVPTMTTACTMVAGDWASSSFVEQTVNASAPHVPGETIKARANNGSITVTRGEGKDIGVTARLKMETDDRIKGTTISVNRLDDKTLEIQAVPPDNKWKSSEGCSFEVRVPEAVAVNLSTSNGRIECVGMSGSSRLKTSNGAVVVKDHAGEIIVRTSNGKIEATNVSGPVDAETSNGSVTARLSDNGAAPVNIQTSNGSITLELPHTCAGSYSAHTSNGRITVPSALPSGKSGSYTSEVRKTSGKFRIGDGGPESNLETSNGSISVTFTGGK